MSGLQGTSIPVAGGYVTTVFSPNEAVWRRLLHLIDTINPDAFSPEPVPESLATLMLRDGVVASPEVIPLGDARGYNPPPDSEGMCYSPGFDGPPNCDGNRTHHAHDAPMPPFDPLQDDDEGQPAEPPRCSTGGCGED